MTRATPATIRVEPLQKHERPACAQCGTLMLPRRIASVTTVETFRTNRRIVKARPVGGGNEWWITYLPDDASGWGYDGLFCRLRCAQQFAHAAHKAGYRRRRP